MRQLSRVLLVVLVSGCSVLRGSLGALRGSSSSSGEPAPPAAPAAKFVAPVTLKVPQQGVVLRPAPEGVERCVGSELGAPFAIVDVPPGEWIIEGDSGNAAVWFLTEPQRAEGRCGGGSARTDLQPGRYLVGFSSPTKGRQARTFAIRPAKNVDPLLHAEVPSELPMEERVVRYWFPFYEPASPVSLLSVVPRQLFQFAPGGAAQLEPASNDPFNTRRETEMGPVVMVQANEPLLRLGDSVYLTTDLSRAYVKGAPQMLAAPTGPVPLPSVRNAWAPAKELLPGPTPSISGAPMSEEAIRALPAPLQAKVTAYYQELARANACHSNANLAYENATTNVILTPGARELALARRDRAQALCKPMFASLDRQRASLIPQFEARRLASLQAAADGAKPHLQELFSSP